MPQSGTGDPHRPNSTTPQYTVQYTQPNMGGIYPANQSHLHNTQRQPMEERQGPPILPPRGVQSNYSNSPHKQSTLPVQVPHRRRNNPQCNGHNMALQVPHRQLKHKLHASSNSDNQNAPNAVVPSGYNSLSRCTDTTLGDTTQDELSDGGSTTSGSYTLDLEDNRLQRKSKTYADTFV